MNYMNHPFYKDSFKKVNPSQSKMHCEKEFSALLTKLANAYNRNSIKHINDWVSRLVSLNCSIEDVSRACEKWIDTQKFHPAYAELKDMILTDKLVKEDASDKAWQLYLKELKKEIDAFKKAKKTIIESVGEENYKVYLKLYFKNVFSEEFEKTLTSFNFNSSHFERLAVKDLIDAKMNSKRAFELGISRKKSLQD